MTPSTLRYFMQASGGHRSHWAFYRTEQGGFPQLTAFDTPSPSASLNDLGQGARCGASV